MRLKQVTTVFQRKYLTSHAIYNHLRLVKLMDDGLAERLLSQTLNSGNYKSVIIDLIEIARRHLRQNLG